MAGGKGGGQTELSSYQIQSSVYNVPLTVGWGSYRASCTILDCVDFQGSPASEGGKGGGKGSSYNYTASIILSINDGPIDLVRTVWRDKDIFTNTAYTTAITNAVANGGATVQDLSQLGLSFALGARGQAPWGYMTSNYPTHALGYSEIAYAYASDYSLGTSGSVSNHSFELQRMRQVVGGVTLDDANPGVIIPDALTSPYYGVTGWPSASIASMTNYSNYCLAAQLLVSPYEDQQRTVADFMTELMQATNSDVVFSEGLLKVVPYGDLQITGNGVTWTPDIAPRYNLTDDDFIVSSKGTDAVKVQYKRPQDAYNDQTLTFKDRANFYNSNTVTFRDQANIAQYGRIRNTSASSIDMICDAGVASRVIQLITQRSAYVQATYEFTLPWYYGLLEPMVDCVTLTTTNLVGVLVRITSMTRDKDGLSYTVEAEDVIVGTATASGSGVQQIGGTLVNTGASPPSIATPILFNGPTSLTENGGNEVWAAVAGSGPDWGGCFVWTSVDGTNYSMALDDAGNPIKQIAASRYGVSTTAVTGAAPSPSSLDFSDPNNSGNLAAL
jgi:hypothetical protein